MKQHYGVPAILSLVIPGLGQLVKGQWERAAIVWALMLIPWAALLGHAVALGSGYIDPKPTDIIWAIRYTPTDIVVTMAQSPFLSVALLFQTAVWLGQVYDAYRYPEAPAQ